LAQTRAQINSSIKRAVLRGIIIYSGQLFVVEASAIASIYMIKLIIDYLAADDRTLSYGLLLFALFAVFRLLTDVARGYYDMHVYNYFQFVTVKV
jgi:ABC-type bacteriocin/lantibiotic exporter with double-glycine peptidase domain